MADTTKQQKILDAARFLALKHGLKGVTMEAIAREARVAKPPLCGYFANKDEVFVGVMEALIVGMRRDFEAALATDGTPVARISAALIAKHSTALKLLEGSPHADALYSEHDRVAGPQFMAFEQLISDAIQGELAKAGIVDSAAMVQLLMSATFGIAAKARTLPELSWGIETITKSLLPGQ